MAKIRRKIGLWLTLGLLLVCCGCQSVSTPDMSGFTIHPGLIIVTHPTENTTVLEIAGDTTLAGFSKFVVAEADHRVAVLDANGQELTQQDAVITDGMTFALYRQGSEKPKLSLPFQVVDPIKVRRYYAGMGQ